MQWWNNVYQETKEMLQQRIYRCFLLSLLIHLLLMLLILILFVIPAGWQGEDMITVTVDFPAPNPPKNEQPAPNQDQPQEQDPVPVPVPVSPDTPQEPTAPAMPDLAEKPPQFTADSGEIPGSDNEQRRLEELRARAAKIAKHLQHRKSKLFTPAPSYSAQGLKTLRSADRQRLLREGGGGRITEKAVAAGLDWLHRHQSQDGRWDCDNFSGLCHGEKCGDPGVSTGDPAVTGLALLAFLGAGHTGEDGKYAKTIARGLQYLLQSQQAAGNFAPDNSQGMYNNAIATFAMAEAALFCRNPHYRQSASRASEYLLSAQNPGLAWRYTYRCGSNDTSVTGWCLLALKACATAEINIPQPAIQDAKNWLNFVTIKGEMPWVGYITPRPGSHSMTAVGIFCRVLFQESYDTPLIVGGASIVSSELPRWGRRNNYYYWYYGTLAMYQTGKRGWDKWNVALKKALVLNQCKKGCARGSWGEGRYNGGRVYWTALAVLCLEVYYRYPRIFNPNLPESKKPENK